MKLTDAQQRGLEYFKFLELPAEERAALRKARKNPKHPDPRVLKALLDKGLIKLDRHFYGPHYKLVQS